MVVIWEGAVYERLRLEWRQPWVTHDIILRKYVKLTARLFLILCLSPTYFPLTISVTEPTFFTFVFVFFFPCPATMLSSYFFMLIHKISSSSNPLFSFTVILSSHPSFYSCCQISLSTLGKLHFSDYTPIKGPVGTLFACCISSLETEKWTVSVCVCVHRKKSYLKY